MGGMLNGQLVHKPMISSEIVNGMVNGEVIWGDSEEIDYIELLCTAAGSPWIKNQWSQQIKYSINDSEPILAPQDGVRITLNVDDTLKIYESVKGTTFRNWANPAGNGGLIHDSDTCRVDIVRMPHMNRFTTDTAGTILGDTAFFNFAKGCIINIRSGFDTSDIVTAGEWSLAQLGWNSSDYISRLESLPTGSFRFDNLLNVGGHFCQGFIYTPSFKGLPEGSFNFPKLTTAGDGFINQFARTSANITSLPDGSFSFPALTSLGNECFMHFNDGGSIQTIPSGSFNFPVLTSVGTNFCSYFNNNGQIRCLVPDAFSTPLLSNNQSSYMISFNDNGKLPRGNEDVVIVNHDSGNRYFSYYNGNADVSNVKTSGATMSYHACVVPSGEHIDIMITEPGTLMLEPRWTTDCIYNINDGPFKACGAWTSLPAMSVGDVIHIYESHPGVTFRNWSGVDMQGIVNNGTAYADITRMPPMDSFTDPDSNGTVLTEYAFKQFLRSPIRNIIAGGFNTSNIVSMGDHCFHDFCLGNGVRSYIENLGDGNFRFPNLTSCGNNVLQGFAAKEVTITSLPAGSFCFPELLSVGNSFCAFFALDSLLACIPTGSFDPSKLTSYGTGYITDMFNNARMIIDNNHYTWVRNRTGGNVIMYFWNGSNQSMTVTPTNGINYHTCDIVAPDAFTITNATNVTPRWTTGGEPLKYTLDNGDTWNDASNGISINVNDSISFIGTGRTGLFNDHNGTNNPWTITGTNVIISGKLNTLLNYKNTNVNLGNYAYDYMFYGAPITDASELIIETTGTYSHSYMFEGCTSLTEPPVLESTDINQFCYAYMFHGCTSLVEAPDLPGTTVMQSCYRNMFDSCINLTVAPELPVMTTSSTCYAEMFNTCVSLEVAPELPAINAASMCYAHMFRDCIKLITPPPVLPTTEVGLSSYEYMFSGCTALESTPIIMATSVTTGGCQSMFNECESLINVSQLPATTIGTNAYANMFNSCTSLLNAPELPAGTLSTGCYTNMFNGCINLLTAPLNNIYTTKTAQAGMFTGATNVREPVAWCRIPTGFGGGGGSGCTDYFTVTGANTIRVQWDNGTFSYDLEYRYSGSSSWIDLDNGETLTVSPPGASVMFHGDTQVTQLFDDADIDPWVFTGDNISISGNINTLLGDNSPLTIGDYCYNNMFNGCTNLKSVDIIMPATTLGISCYRGMFKGCTGLTSLKLRLPAKILTNSCYYEMFNGCTSLNELPIIEATTLAAYCYYGMFESCSSITNIPFDYLPITTIAPYCYKNMLSKTAIITGPELPATIMTPYCYDNLFYGCPNLTTPPELPSVTLANNCYDGMFYQCISLLTLPELPATVMAAQCYQFMFYGCTSITSLPDNYLSSTQLAECCYRYMFQRTGLVDISNFILPATILTRRCYAAFCQECSNLTTVNTNMLPAVSLAEGCYDQMFIHCTSLIAAPALPASVLQVKCYRRMLNDCTSLTTIPGAEVYTLISSLPSNSVLAMFTGDTAITIPLTYSQIPSAWK